MIINKYILQKEYSLDKIVDNNKDILISSQIIQFVIPFIKTNNYYGIIKLKDKIKIVLQRKFTRYPIICAYIKNENGKTILIIRPTIDCLFPPLFIVFGIIILLLNNLLYGIITTGISIILLIYCFYSINSESKKIYSWIINKLGNIK